MAARTGKILELAGRALVRRPVQFPFVKKDVWGRYTLDGRVVEASPVGEIMKLELELNGNNTKHKIRMAMTVAALSDKGFDANAVYIMGKNGTMHYGKDGKDKTWYQPLRLKYE